MDMLDWVQRMATKMRRGMENLSYKETLSGWGCSAWRRLRGDLTVTLEYLKGACKKDGDKLFSRACCNRTRGNVFKLRE